jgi:hypothetical protein
MPTYLQYHHLERKNSFVDNGVKCPSFARNCANDKADSDTTLHLGYSAFLFPNNKASCKIILLIVNYILLL